MRNEKKVILSLNEAVGAHLWNKFRPQNIGEPGNRMGSSGKGEAVLSMFITSVFLGDAAEDAGLLKMLLSLKNALAIPSYTLRSPAAGVKTTYQPTYENFNIKVRLFSTKRTHNGPLDWDFQVEFHTEVDLWGAFLGWVLLSKRDLPDKRSNLKHPQLLEDKQVFKTQLSGTSGKDLKKAFIEAVRLYQRRALSVVTKLLMKYISKGTG